MQHETAAGKARQCCEGQAHAAGLHCAGGMNATEGKRGWVVQAVPHISRAIDPGPPGITGPRLLHATAETLITPIPGSCACAKPARHPGWQRHRRPGLNRPRMEASRSGEAPLARSSASSRCTCCSSDAIVTCCGTMSAHAHNALLRCAHATPHMPLGGCCQQCHANAKHLRHSHSTESDILTELNQVEMYVTEVCQDVTVHTH